MDAVAAAEPAAAEPAPAAGLSAGAAVTAGAVAEAAEVLGSADEESTPPPSPTTTGGGWSFWGATSPSTPPRRPDSDAVAAGGAGGGSPVPTATGCLGADGDSPPAGVGSGAAGLKGLRSMSVEEVVEWVGGSLGLPAGTAAAFREHEVDGDTLADASREVLREELGIRKLGAPPRTPSQPTGLGGRHGLMR